MPTERKSIKKTYLTIDDIAAMAGVSKSTVSRVLNNKPGVNRETRARIEKLLVENHFAPNASAQGLVSQSSRIIQQLGSVR